MAAPSDYKEIQTNSGTKTREEFRTYTQDEETPARVVEHYRDMRRYQTLEFYERMERKYSFADETYRQLMTIEEAFVALENYVDASDPDMDLVGNAVLSCIHQLIDCTLSAFLTSSYLLHMS